MPMTHDQLSELLSAYLDGEVDAREKALAEERLRIDPAAQRLLDELRRTVAVVGALPRHAAPPTLALELDAQLERRELLSGFRADSRESALRKAPWRASLRAAAMLAIVLGAGWWFLSHQQEKRPDGLAKSGATDTNHIESTTATLRESARPVPAVPAETLLASGADPVVLVRNSFEPEPNRLRVMTRDVKERDTLKKQFVTQVAEAKAENLSRRDAASEGKREVGSFYLEGKPGVNFANAQDRQVLVRMPAASVERIVGDVVSAGKIPSDQLAFQMGSSTVRGPDNARAVLQTIAQRDQPAVAAEMSRPSPPAGLLNTLGEMVGLGPLAKLPAPTGIANFAAGPKPDSVADDRARAASNEISDTDHAMADAAKSKDAKEEEGNYRSLVDKRFEAARTASDRSDEGIREKAASAPLAGSGSSPAEPFITMVVEFVIPEPKTPPAKEAGR